MHSLIEVFAGADGNDRQGIEGFPETMACIFDPPVFTSYYCFPTSRSVSFGSIQPSVSCFTFKSRNQQWSQHTQSCQGQSLDCEKKY